MLKIVEARVSKNSNPATLHIGQYVVETVYVTESRERPLAMRVVKDPADFIAKLTAQGLANGAFVEMVDNTGE